MSEWLDKELQWPSNVDKNASRIVLAVALGEAWEIIAKLRELHQPDGRKMYSHAKSEQWCGQCGAEGGEGEYGCPWPCSTIRVINGEELSEVKL